MYIPGSMVMQWFARRGEEKLGTSWTERPMWWDVEWGLRVEIIYVGGVGGLVGCPKRGWE